MNTRIQTFLVIERNLDNVVVSIRLRGAEAARFWRIMDDAKAKNPYIDRSDVIRELLGLDPLNILKETDVLRFQGRNTEGVSIAPTTRQPILQHITKTNTQAKRRAK